MLRKMPRGPKRKRILQLHVDESFRRIGSDDTSPRKHHGYRMLSLHKDLCDPVFQRGIFKLALAEQ
jgi:hypothetical protein